MLLEMRMPESNSELSEHGNFESTKPQFKVKRVNVAKRKSKKKIQTTQSCQHLCSLRHLGVNSNEQRMVSFSPRHMIFILLTPLQIGLLQLHYQSKNVSPFDTHPVNMWVFFGSSCIYCCGLTISMGRNLEENDKQIIISHVNLGTGTGSLASISLASIFIPRLLGFLCLALWAILPIVLARHFINQIYHVWLKPGTLRATSQAGDGFRKSCGFFTLKKQQLPV